jgi:hypothetical protein
MQLNSTSVATDPNIDKLRAFVIQRTVPTTRFSDPLPSKSRFGCVKHFVGAKANTHRLRR